MLSKVCSAAVNGIDAYPVEVEVNAGWGDTLVVMIATNHQQNDMRKTVVPLTQPDTSAQQHIGHLKGEG